MKKMKSLAVAILLLGASAVIAQTTTHTLKDGTSVKVETNNGGSKTSGGRHGSGENSNTTHAAANKEVVKVGNDTGNPVVKSNPPMGGSAQK